eukprot:scaffold1053_cov107-Isochrysis_galbana.AAC.5
MSFSALCQLPSHPKSPTHAWPERVRRAIGFKFCVSRCASRVSRSGGSSVPQILAHRPGVRRASVLGR